jgi:preprotein translocase subunit YajC
MGILILLLFFVAAWFLLIVPRQRELRRHRELMAQLAPGDEVITSAGVYGTIRSIDGDVVHLEVAPALELKMAKRAIVTMVAPPRPALEDASVLDLTEEDDGDDGDDAGDASGGPDRPDIAEA